MIDEDTLLRLLDECKDEEARLSIMMDTQSSHSQSQICRQNDLTQIELESFDSVTRRLKEAELIAIEADKMANEVTLEYQEYQQRPQLDIGKLIIQQDRSIQKVEDKLTAARTEVDKFKTRVYDVMAEMEQMTIDLNRNADKLQKLQVMKDEEREPYQLPPVEEHERDEVAEEPDSDLLKQVMADVAHFNLYQSLLKERDRLMREEMAER